MTALLFDLDGTMLDTDPLHLQVFIDLMAPLGLTVDHAFYMRHVHGRLNVDVFAEFLPDHPDPQGLSNQKEALFREILPKPYPEMPGLTALLDRAAAMDAQMAVVTNAERANAEAMLAAIGHRDRFDLLVIGEECSNPKPYPAPYLEAARLLNVDPTNCIAFEDSPSGVRAAAAAGVYTVGVRSSLDDETLKAAGADITLSDFNDTTLNTVLERATGGTP